VHLQALALSTAVGPGASTSTVVKYCCWPRCVEGLVKFLNRNAYILVAVRGTNYCRSAQRAVVLIMANIVTLAVVNTVGDFLIFLGKISVAVGCGLVAFAMSDSKYYTDAAKVCGGGACESHDVMQCSKGMRQYLSSRLSRCWWATCINYCP
jgi:Plasma-membrane choline transporter